MIGKGDPSTDHTTHPTDFAAFWLLSDFSFFPLRPFTVFCGCKCVILIWLQMLRKERSRLCRQNLKVCLAAIISVSVVR